MRKQDRILQQKSQSQPEQKTGPGSTQPMKAPSRDDHTRDVPREPGKLPLPD
jgi:hypothetical protein